MKAQAAETGIEPIFPESESGVLPLHHSAIADAERFELLSCSFGDCCVAITPGIYEQVDVVGFEPTTFGLRDRYSTS